MYFTRGKDMNLRSQRVDRYGLTLFSPPNFVGILTPSASEHGLT